MEIPPGDTLLLPNMTFLVMGGIFAKDLDSVVLQVCKQFSFVLCHFLQTALSQSVCRSSNDSLLYIFSDPDDRISFTKTQLLTFIL